MNYIAEVKEKIKMFNEERRRIKDDYGLLKSEIESYLADGSPDYNRIVNDKKLLQLINGLPSNVYKGNLIGLLKNLSSVSSYALSINSNVERIEKLKSRVISELRIILDSGEMVDNIECYDDLSEILDFFDLVGKDTSINSKDLSKYLFRFGFSPEEVNEFLGKLAIMNMKVYESRMRAVEDEFKKKLEKRENRIIKADIKANSLANNCSLKTQILLNKVKLILDNYEISLDEEDYQMAESYSEIILGRPGDVLEVIPKEAFIKYIIIKLRKTLSEINEFQTVMSEEDFSLEISILRTLMENYEGLIVQDDMVDCPDVDYLDDQNGIKIYYLIDEKTNTSYYELSLSNTNRSKFAEKVLNKIKRGITESNNKGDVLGVDGAFVMRQADTFVSFIKASDDCYIVVTSSGKSGIYTETERIVKANLEQIQEIKKVELGEAI